MSKPNEVAQSRFAARQRFILSVGVLLLAAGLRLWQISQVPPGLHIDEAFILLRGLEVGHSNHWPVFIPGNNGVEPVSVYLTALMLNILGPVKWAGRLGMALTSLVGVAATIRMGRELFPRSPIGVVAGLTLATLLSSLTFSRMGIQPLLAMPAAACAMAAFWHGVRTQDRRAYVLAGICVGLGLDSYVAFRLFPVVVVAMGVATGFTKRTAWREMVVGVAVTAVAAGIVFAPLAWFFTQQPQWFFMRFQQTTSGTLNWASLSANISKVVGGIFLVGDVNWRHNLAGRPALDVAQALFFAGGIGLCLWRWRQPETWALLSWLGIGLVPSILSDGAPHFGRMTMVTPVLALLVAVGVGALWQQVRHLWMRGLILCILALSSALSAFGYFGPWAHSPQMYYAYTGEQSQLAQTIKALPGDVTVFNTPKPLSDGTQEYYWALDFLLHSGGLKRLVVLDGLTCTVFPAPASTTVYTVMEYDQRTERVLKTAYLGLALWGTVPYLAAYRLPAGQTPVLPISHALQIDFGKLARLRGYTLTPSRPMRGEEVKLNVAWEARRPSSVPYKVFVHLTGTPQADGNIIYAQQDGLPCDGTYTTDQWQPGEVVVDTYTLLFPKDLPGGNYTLLIGWYDYGTGARLPVLDATGQLIGDFLPLEQVQVP